MFRQRPLIAVLGLLLIVGLVGSHFTPKASADDIKSVTLVSPVPLPVTGTVGISGPISLNPNTILPVFSAEPPRAFTMPPAQVFLVYSGSPAVTPDPSGTRYAITSVVLTNNTANTGEITLKALAFSFASPTCQSPANQTAIADGPILTVGAHTTATLTFPQPFVTAPVAGPQVCLVAGSNSINFAGVTWSAVGYRL